MFVLFIVFLMKLLDMYTNNNKLARNKCARNAKENCFGGSSVIGLMNQNNYYKMNHKYGMCNGIGGDESLFVKNVENDDDYFMNYFCDIDQSNIDHIKEYLHQQSGIKSLRGMTDYSNKPANTKLSKTGLLSHHQQQQQLGYQIKPALLKQPLSSVNTNYNTLNTCNNNNNVPAHVPQQQQTFSRTRTLQHQQRNARNLNGSDIELSDDSLKSNVQIVLKNIQNALLLNSKKEQQQYQQENINYNQDRFHYLNIFNNNNKNRTMSTSPADCDNTNNNMGPTSMLGCSFASSQDFTHDNSDYQWFVDYGYRDGVQHHSILSSLSASYNGIGELSYYDDLAKNLDMNLAEVDMENFRTEDIHSLLTEENVTSMGNRRTRKLQLKDQNEFDNSICKSEILFSPVKESHISIDSLDMEGYQDDLILTCQANLNNYTIAFEGSCMYSDDSYYDIPENNKLKQNSINLDNILHNKKTMDVSMTQSDTGFTTWSKVKKSSSNFIQMQKYPSGNNNMNDTTTGSNNNSINTCTHHFTCDVRKSSSMPNLKSILQQQEQHRQMQLNVSQVVSSSNASMDSVNKHKTMMPMFPIPISTSSETESGAAPMNNSSCSNNEKVTNPPSFNLVKLFIKQKSSSSDTCMDVSSGCWPSDSTNSSTEHPAALAVNNNVNSAASLNRMRKKSMNDSGKCSALSRHEEDAEEYQYDSLDAHVNNNNGEETVRKTNDFNREVFDSPTHKRTYKDCNLNIRNQLKNPLLYNLMNNNNTSGSGSNSINNNNNNSFKSTQSDASRTSENLTQILKDQQQQDGEVVIPIDMFTKSIQTSTILMQPVNESKKQSQSFVKMIPPSFLTQLNKLGDQQQAPVYVIYPNYALPDLEFIQHQPMRIKNDIIVSPLDYQFSMARTLNLKHHKPTVQLKRRPQSLNIDKLQQHAYEHVVDWKSLWTLLPRDYKKLLKNVPEVATMESSVASQKPMFCMTPPIRRTTTGLTCDCATLVQNHTANSSSSGGSSSQPPSSGYRGSSTLLTDSEMESIIGGGSGGDAMKNMFVYQYDNVPELTEQRPPTGRRGILRRTNTTTNTPMRVSGANPAGKVKRYSMIEQQQQQNQQQTQQKQQHANTNQQQAQDKRRSLQEPNFYNQNIDLEEYLNGVNGKTFGNRLPNYMKARDHHEQDPEKDLNQLMTELELNKAISNKLNYGQQTAENVDIQEIEARLRAESFLNSIPKSELKHYAEVANLLEWTDNRAHQESPQSLAERTKLRNEVSRALASRKVSFNPTSSPVPSPSKTSTTMKHLLSVDKKFSTPPNSPSMSQLVNNTAVNADKRHQQKLEREKQDKIQSNRFKRLQIQWELLSKDAMENSQDSVTETKSGGSTPTGALKLQSKIPRPVSYPNSKQTPEMLMAKNLRSPSRMSAPKKYTTTPTNNQTMTSPTTGIPRTPSKLHTTPKKTLPMRSTTRTR